MQLEVVHAFSGVFGEVAASGLVSDSALFDFILVLNLVATFIPIIFERCFPVLN